MAERTRDLLSETVVERLNLILRVVALQVAPDKSITERACLLKAAGLDNVTIAELLDTTPATIRTVTSNFRKKPRRGRR